MGAGCGPLQGIRDPCLGMLGAVWDFYVVLEQELALAGVEQRVVWLHPSAHGDLKCMSDDSAVDRFNRWNAVQRTGMPQQLRVLYPTLGPRKYPRGPQPQIGYDEARERLLGGGGTGGLSLWARSYASAGTSATGIALAVVALLPLASPDDNSGGSAAATGAAATGAAATGAAATGAAAAGAAVATAASSSGGALAAPAPPPPPPKPLPSRVLAAPLFCFEFLDAAQTRARWCGLDLWLWKGESVELVGR